MPNLVRCALVLLLLCGNAWAGFEDGAAAEKRGDAAVQERVPADLSSTIADLVKKYDAALPAAPIQDPERAKLARAFMEDARWRELSSKVPVTLADAIDAQQRPSNISLQVFEAWRAVLIASFQPDQFLATLARKAAERLDAPTLQVGEQWNRSDVGRRINNLRSEALRPEQRDARSEFAREFRSRGATGNEERARDCAQVDVLTSGTESRLSQLEAVIAGSVIATSGQLHSLDIDGVRRFVAARRAQMRELVRQDLMSNCLFDFRGLTDAEFDQWLEFLRSAAGGRYARGVNEAIRDTILERTEIYTRVLLEVMRQLRGSA